MSNNITIAISGKSGCGNTTVSKIVADKLNLKFINYTFRTMADEKGISFEELRHLAEESTAIDMELDKKQVNLAAEGNCVLGSRLAIWMIADADLKVYLTASSKVRAGRIADRENGTMADEKGISFEELRQLAEESTAIDMELDKKQVNLAKEGNCVLGSRLAIWMIADADLKVYLTASSKVRAGRIADRENGTLEEKVRETEDRDQKDSARYKKIYAIDTSKYEFADLIIDTDVNNVNEVVDLILEAVESLQ